MQNQKPLNNKKFLNLMIPLIIMLIGIGFIIWSAINIIIYSTYHIEEKSIQDFVVDYPEKIIIYNKSIYKIYPSKGEYIGTIEIPALNEVFPIYEGTSVDELKKGVGHFIQSALPGEKNNSVISGHRNTVFKNLGELKKADLIIIKTSAGEFTYELTSIKIVEKDDKTVIVPTKDAILTITTCYPFNYVGSAPYRYIISAILIKSK